MVALGFTGGLVTTLDLTWGPAGSEVPLNLTSGSMWLLFYSCLVMQSDCSGWDLWSNGDALD